MSGVGVRGAGDSGQTDELLAVARVVNERRITLSHAANVLQSERVGYPVPDGMALALQLVEGINVGVGLKDPVRQCAAYFATANVFESTESPLA